MIKTENWTEQSMSLDGLTTEQIIAKARSLRQQGMNKKAIEMYRKALQSEPENLDVLNELGLTHILIGEQDDAIVAFDLAIDIAPADYRGYSNKAEAYLTLGSFEEANEAAEKGIELIPDSAELWTMKARALESLLRIQEATDAYNEALKYNSEDPVIWKALALCLDAQEQWPAVARAYRIAAGIHQKRGEMQDADSCLKFAEMAERS
jgi:tetratricopeptide (TPR) repeat protein